MYKCHQNLSIYTWCLPKLCGFAAMLDLHLSECSEGHSTTNATAGTSSASPPAAVSPLPLAWNPRCSTLSVLTSVLMPAKLVLKNASTKRTSFINIPAFRFQQDFFFNRITFQVVFIFNYENERWKPNPSQNPISKWRKLCVTLRNSFRVRCSWTQGKSSLYQCSNFPSGNNGALANLRGPLTFIIIQDYSWIQTVFHTYQGQHHLPTSGGAKEIRFSQPLEDKTHTGGNLIAHFAAVSLFVWPWEEIIQQLRED